MNKISQPQIPSGRSRTPNLRGRSRSPNNRRSRSPNNRRSRSPGGRRSQSPARIRRLASRQGTRNCSIGFEFELSNVLLLESPRFNNIDRGDGHLDSTPGFFLPLCLDKKFTELTGFGVFEGDNKVKFDHDSGLISERLEFESKPIYAINFKHSEDEFKKFIRGIVFMLTNLREAALGKEKKLMKYFNREFGSDKTRRKNKSKILNMARGFNSKSTTGTVQITYGISLDSYQKLLLMTPGRTFSPREIETLKRHFILSVYEVLAMNTEIESRENNITIEIDKSNGTFIFDTNNISFENVPKIFPGLFTLIEDPESNLELFNFLFLIHNYKEVLGFQWSTQGDLGLGYTLRPWVEGDTNTGLKGNFPLMLRNKFSDIYHQLLSPENQKLFKQYSQCIIVLYQYMHTVTGENELPRKNLKVVGFVENPEAGSVLFGKKIYGDLYFPMELQVPLIDSTFGRGLTNQMSITYVDWLRSIYEPEVMRPIKREEYLIRLRKKNLESEAGVHPNETAKQWAIRTMTDTNRRSDLLSPPISYAKSSSVIGGGGYAMGAYPITNDQILFLCRECISGPQTIEAFANTGLKIVNDFTVLVCDKPPEELPSSSRRSVRKRNKWGNLFLFSFTRKRRSRKKSRKRRSRKKSRKRRSRKKSRKAKKKISRKRRSRKKSRKAKKKISRKRFVIKKSE